MARRKKGVTKNLAQNKSIEKLIKERARNLTIGKCFVSENWEETKVGHLIITRVHSNKNVTYCLLLIDLALYGVKDVSYDFNTPWFEIEERLDRVPMQFNEIPYELAHNIVFSGLEYAEDFGFNPHKDWKTVQYILEEDTDDIPLIDIECGIDGRPTIFKDTAITFLSDLKKLEENAGEGNFSVLYDDIDDDLENEWDEEPNLGRFDDFVGQMIEDDVLDYAPEVLYNENFNLADYLDTEIESFVMPVIISLIYHEHIGLEYLNDIELVEHAIGEDKEISFDFDMSDQEKKLLKKFSDEGTSLDTKELEMAIDNYPDNPELAKLMIEYVSSEEVVDDHAFLNDSLKLIKRHPNNLLFMAYHLAALGIEGKRQEFNNYLEQSDFYHKILEGDNDIYILHYVYYCIVKSFSYTLDDNLEMSDKYYFASRVCSGIYENAVVAILLVKLTELKIQALMQAGLLNNKEDNLKVVHSNKN